MKSSKKVGRPKAIGCRKGPLKQLQEAPPASSMTPSNPRALLGLEAESHDKLLDRLVMQAKRITGAKWSLAAERAGHYMGNALVWPPPKDTDEAVLQALVMLDEMAPKNFTEAMLAAQTVATNEAALMFLRRAVTGQDPALVDANVARATRLMRLHLEQIEAMQKLRGLSGQQKIVVERVDVHAGGQAVVGAIAAPVTPGDGGGR